MDEPRYQLLITEQLHKEAEKEWAAMQPLCASVV